MKWWKVGDKKNVKKGAKWIGYFLYRASLWSMLIYNMCIIRKIKKNSLKYSTLIHVLIDSVIFSCHGYRALHGHSLFSFQVLSLSS